ncbi:MAG: V-type ATP synthase subunit E [Clostridiales bacterium]|nr:V-type ATP synthase subunit E [Clostridiales bacterium]
MHGKQKLIDEILTSAKKTAAAMVDEATAEQTEALTALRKELDAAQAESLKLSEKAADDYYAGQVKIGDLEAGKAILRAKQRCVAAVYDGVRDKILSAPDAEYLALLQKLIVSVCEDGDEVVAAKTDGKRVTAAWVKKVSSAAKKKLTLSKEQGDFAGGVILRNARYDRDLSVDEIVEELKDRTIGDTVQKLGL